MTLRYRLFVIFCYFYTNHVIAHIPMQYEMAEPDGSGFNVNLEVIALNKQQSLDRLTSLRSVMAEQGIRAYIVPTADAHNSQYIAPCDARREWISGFTGSAGTVAVTLHEALLWTDGRYFTQFEMEVNATLWKLMRPGVEQALQPWLVANMPSGSVVGVDPTTYTRNEWTPLQNALAQVNVTLRAISENLVDIARRNIEDPPPERSTNPIIAHTLNYTGKISNEKIIELQAQISSRNASALVLTALDDIAYTLNLRGSDIPYNPVFFAYLIILNRENSSSDAVLFWGNGTLSADIYQHLAVEGTRVESRPYSQIFEYLTNLTTELPAGSVVWLTQDGSHAVHMAAESNEKVTTLSTISPVALIKCIKNQVELQGFRLAHVKDGTALVRFLRWIHEQVDAGNSITEIQISDKLVKFREDEVDFVGPSFETIAGAGGNGAIIHYKPPREGNLTVVKKDHVLLVDSGGQYKDGTTDITRTRHMSSLPNEAQRRAFTRVMKGQIMLGTAVFPRGITGNVLETLARKSLWDVGLNYAHGTGHGVGHFLNVHEGPAWILSSLIPGDPGIVESMIFSNEPGYYEVGEYGVRHEDLVEVIPLDKESDHLLAQGLVGDFDGRGALGFRTISLVPHQTACLDIDLLTDFEIQYINGYHARVLATLGPILRRRNLTQDYEWLERECAPIKRNAAIVLTSGPILVVISVFSMWINA